jgi:hypothetical protein
VSLRRASALTLSTLVTLGALLAASRPASAFVRSRTDGAMKPFAWETTCAPVTIYVNGFNKYTLDEIAKSVSAAAHAWSPDGVACPGTASAHPYFEIVPSLDPTAKPPDVAWDARNAIIFRTEMWTKSGKPPVNPLDNYAFDALAVTTVVARANGKIVDADIEINALNKTWLDLDPGVTPPFDHGAVIEVHDLQNTLTHEFGHFIGLDHTCFTFNPNSNKMRPIDDATGKPVPDCDGAPGLVAATTMFDRAEPAETNKRTLENDDMLGVCTIYPPALDPHVCSVDQPNDGCAVAGGTAGQHGRGRVAGGAIALGAGMALVAAAARRRARGRA